jgi:hypothetical protein
MSALSIQPTFPIFTGTDGLPLENGYIWIGTANLDPQGNPINVYWDAALTITAAQPIRTLAGYPSRNGTPARVYVNSDYSIRVQDKNASTVYSAPAATERISSDLVTYQPPFTGGVATTVQAKLAQTISVKDFGAVGDGVTDDTAAIQNAIDYATYFAKAKCYLPGGRYRITKTLQAGYGVGFPSNPYASPHIYGDGMVYRGETFSAGTVIIADFNNAPAINFQGVRTGSMSDISIVGQNLTYALTNRLGSWGLTAAERPTVNDLLVSNWIDPAFPAASSSRYAPYAGITTDAYSGSRPATSYPDVTYPAFLGTVSQWNKVGTSAQISFNNVYVAGFYGGLVTYPSGGDGQGEFYQFNSCLFEYNAYGVVITHTQARNFVLNGSRVENSWAALVNGVFGNQNGSAVFEAYGCAFDRNINILQLSGGANGPAVLNGCYGESNYRLGDFTFGGATSRQKITLDGCEFSFAGQNARGAPESLMGGQSGIASVSNCKFANFLGLPMFDLNVSDFSGNNFSLTDVYGGWCFVRTGAGDKIPPLYGYYPLVEMGVALRSSAPSPFIGEPQLIENFNPTTGVAVSGNIVAGGNDSGYIGRGAPSLVSSSTKTNNAAADGGILNGFNGFAQRIVGRTTYTLTMSGVTATITVPALASEDVYNISGMNPGDLIVWSDGVSTKTPRVFYIRARTANVITAELQNGFTVTVDGSGYPTVPTVSGTVDASRDLYFHCCRFYMPTVFQNATLTAASAVMTVVETPVGTMSTTDFAVDDAFYAAEYTDYWITPTSSRITIVDSGAKTITLVGNSRVTERRRIPVMIKKAPVNS